MAYLQTFLERTALCRTALCRTAQVVISQASEAVQQPACSGRFDERIVQAAQLRVPFIDSDTP